MDYKKTPRLHFVNKLSGKDVAANCGCSKTTANEFLRRFKDCPELSYPLPEDVTNEYIENLLYKKPARLRCLNYTGASMKKLSTKLFLTREKWSSICGSYTMLKAMSMASCP